MLFAFQIVIYHIYCVIFATTNHPYPFLVWAHLLRGSFRVARSEGTYPLGTILFHSFPVNK